MRALAYFPDAAGQRFVGRAGGRWQHQAIGDVAVSVPKELGELIIATANHEGVQDGVVEDGGQLIPALVTGEGAQPIRQRRPAASLQCPGVRRRRQQKGQHAALPFPLAPHLVIGAAGGDGGGHDE